MALDFYELKHREHLFSLGDSDFIHLESIFKTFTQWTGLVIDPYTDMKLSAENCLIIISIIDKYIAAANLNDDKARTTSITGLRGLLHYFSQKGFDFQLIGD